MASIFIRTKNIPPDSDNQYCYLVKQENGKQKQKYIGPTKDIDLENWDPESFDEEPPTDYEPGEGMASDKKEEGSIDKLEDLWDALGGKDTNKHDLGEEHVDVYKKDDYKDGYYIAVDEPGHTVKAIFEVDEKDWEAAKEEFNGTDSNAPDQFLSDRQSASVPKINLNEGKGKRIALYDEDGEDVFNYNAFSFKLFEKAVRASRDGSYKNSELAGAEISWKESEYPMVLETSDMDFVFAPVIIDMDSGNQEFLRYIRDDGDGDYIFISDQHDSVESALGDNPTKPSNLPGFEWEYTPNSDDRRARNLDTVEIEELTANQQEDWYSESELREENWIKEHVEDNDEGFYPIPVIERNGSYLVQDGHHRVSYAKLRGLSNVVVETGYKYEYKPVNSDSVKTQYGYEFINPDDEKLGSMYYREREKEFRQGVENGKLDYVLKDGKRIFGSVVGKTEIYGRSDDLVYIKGDDKEEIGAYNTDVFIEIGGLTLKMEYSYSWNITVLADSSSLDYELEDNGKEENDKLVIDGQPEYDYSFNVEDLSFVGEEEEDSSNESSELTVDDAKEGDLGSLHTVMATEKGQSFSDLQENTDLKDEEIREGLKDLQELGLIYEREEDYYNYLGEDKTKEEHQKEIEEDDSSKSYGGIGGGRRKKLDKIEEFDRLKKLEKSDIEDADDVRQYIKDMKLPRVATARGSNIDVDDLLNRFNSTYNDLPNEEAKQAYVKDHKMFRTLRSSRRHFNKLVDRQKRFAEMPSAIEAGPAKYPTGKRDKKRKSLRNQKEKVEEKIDRLYGRLKGAKQRALNSVGTSVGEQNEKKRESEREEMIDYLEEGWTVSFFHGDTSVGRIKRVNKKSVTFEYWGYTHTGRIGSDEGHHEVKTYNLELPSDRFAVIEAELTKPAMEIIEQDDFSTIQNMDETPEKITEDFIRDLRDDLLQEEIDEIHEKALKEKRKREEDDVELVRELEDGSTKSYDVTESKVDSMVDTFKSTDKVVRITVDGEEVYNDKEDQEEGMDKELVKELFSNGIIVTQEASENLTKNHVMGIKMMSYPPMIVNQLLLDRLDKKPTAEPEYRRVKMVTEFPAFTTVNLNRRPESEPGDEVRMPETNAEILVNRGNAEYVDNNSLSSGSSSSSSNNSSNSSSSQGSDSSEFSSERLDEVRKTIYKLDEGKGADYKDVLDEASEEEIDYLKKIGDLYEPTQGSLKLLDYELEDQELTKEEVFEKINTRDYNKYHEGGQVFSFTHKETNQDLWIQKGEYDDGYTVYGDIFRILRNNGVIDAPGAEKTFYSKSDALHEFKLYAMNFNNNYKEYMDIEEKTDSSMLDAAEAEILEELNSNPDGVKYDELSKRTDAKDELLEEAANTLLSEGTAYEPRPGVIKKL